MTRITAWIEALAFTIGGFGIFVIAFLDSSFLSFPEANDFLVVLMVVRHPDRMIFYATMATLGSIAGFFRGTADAVVMKPSGLASQPPEF